MSDDAVRPRRALPPDDSAAVDDSPGGLVDNPFARPRDGVESSPAPAPVRARRALPADHEPAEDDTIEVPRVEDPPSMIPAPVLPNRGEGFFDGPGPRPRRSALSSVTPPEIEEAHTPSRAAVPSPPRTVESLDDDAVIPEYTEDEPWWRRRLPALVAGGVAIAVLAAGAGYLGHRMGTSAAQQAAQASSASPTPSPSPTVARITDEALLSVDDAAGAVTGTWTAEGTTNAPNHHAAAIPCLSKDPGTGEPVQSLQRILAAPGEQDPEFTHQLDVYRSPELAQAAFRSRSLALAGCSELPVRLVGSTTVEGVSDEAMQLTISMQDEAKRFHTLLLTRTGDVISIVDGATNGQALSTGAVVSAFRRSAEALCDGTCAPDEAVIEATSLPAVEPRGWLAPNDLPRVRAGAGRWTFERHDGVTTQGMGCEDFALATEPGPTKRQQVHYTLADDEQTPERFGVDELVFDFADEEAAQAFEDRLTKGLGTCNDRASSAEVTALSMPEQTKGFAITHQTDETDDLYQLAVLRRGTRVVYLLTTAAPKYSYTQESFGQLATRAGDRLAQLD